MDKILSSDHATDLSQSLQSAQKKVVLAGGCFDVLHPGHIHFLTHAKKQGDILVLILESDENMKKFKGKGRPIHTQQERAYVLSALAAVDYIISLPRIFTNEEYDKLVIQIKPAIIATTAGDGYLEHKKRQAKLVNARVIAVTEKVPEHSTTRIAELLTNEL